MIPTTPQINFDLVGGTLRQGSGDAWPGFATLGDPSIFSGERASVQGSWADTGRWWAILLPYAFDISSYLWAYYITISDDGNYSKQLQWSTDTTTGNDGTWTAATVPGGTEWPSGGTSRTGYRDAAKYKAVTWNACKGVRFGARAWAGGSGYAVNQIAFHLYGLPTAGSQPTRLDMWHPTLDQRLTNLDMGQLSSGGVRTVAFRVKNSSALTAQNIVVTDNIASGSDTTPTLTPHLTLSANNTTYVDTSLSVPGSLAAGQVSGLVYAKYRFDPTLPLGNNRLRLKAVGEFV